MDNPIKILTGAQRVRLRPAVIFGSDDAQGAKCALEMLLCVMSSECRNGFATELSLIQKPDGSMEIQDNGRGLYLGSGREDDPAWQRQFCQLGWEYPERRDMEYSCFEESGEIPSRPYESETYDSLDLCAVQYASQFMYVTAVRDGMEFCLRFQKGENKGGLSVKQTDAPSGTRIHFKPDPEVFTSVEISGEDICQLLKELAMLLPGCRMLFRKETAEGVYRKVYCYPQGMESYLSERTGQCPATRIYTAQIRAVGRERYNRPEYGAQIRVALCFCKDSGFTEVLHNWRVLRVGGTHITGILQEIQKRLQWQLDIPVGEDVINKHLCLVVSTTTSKNGSCWGNGARTWIENKMITDMARDCVLDDFTYYVKRHKAELLQLFTGENK